MMVCCISNQILTPNTYYSGYLYSCHNIVAIILFTLRAVLLEYLYCLARLGVVGTALNNTIVYVYLKYFRYVVNFFLYYFTSRVERR